jgi:hypothetical protein
VEGRRVRRQTEAWKAMRASRRTKPGRGGALAGGRRHGGAVPLLADGGLEVLRERQEMGGETIQDDTKVGCSVLDLEIVSVR